MAIANSFYDGNPDLGAPLAPALPKKPAFELLEGGELLPPERTERPDLTLIRRDGTKKSITEILEPKDSKEPKKEVKKGPRTWSKAKKTAADFKADYERYRTKTSKDIDPAERPEGPQNLREQAAFIAAYYGERIGNIPSVVTGEMAKVRGRVNETMESIKGRVKRKVLSWVPNFMKSPEIEQRNIALAEQPFTRSSFKLPNGEYILLSQVVLERDGKKFKFKSVSSEAGAVFAELGPDGRHINREGEEINYQTPRALFESGEFDIFDLSEAQILGLEEIGCRLLIEDEKLFKLPNGSSINLLGAKFEKEGMVYVVQSISSLGQLICLSDDGKEASLVLSSAEDLFFQENVDLGELTLEQEAGIKAMISTYVDRVIDENKIEKRSVQLTGENIESPFEGEILTLPNGEVIDLLTLTLDHNGQVYRATRVTDAGQLVFWAHEGQETLAFESPVALFLSASFNEDAELTERQRAALNEIKLPKEAETEIAEIDERGRFWSFMVWLALKTGAVKEEKPLEKRMVDLRSDNMESPFEGEILLLPNGAAIDLLQLSLERSMRGYHAERVTPMGQLVFKADKGRKTIIFASPEELFLSSDFNENDELTSKQIAGLNMIEPPIVMEEIELALADRFFDENEFVDDESFKTYPLPNGETINLQRLEIIREGDSYRLSAFNIDRRALEFKNEDGDRLEFSTARELFEAEGFQYKYLMDEQIEGLEMMGMNIVSSYEDPFPRTREGLRDVDLGKEILTYIKSFISRGESLGEGLSLQVFENHLEDFANNAMKEADPDLSLVSRLDACEGVEARILEDGGFKFAFLVSYQGVEFYVPLDPSMRFHLDLFDVDTYKEPEGLVIKDLWGLPRFKIDKKSGEKRLEKKGGFMADWDALVPLEEGVDDPFMEGEASFVLPSASLVELEDCVLRSRDKTKYEFAVVSSQRGAIFNLVDESGVVLRAGALNFKTPAELLNSPHLNYEASFNEEVRAELAELGYEAAPIPEAEAFEEREGPSGARHWLFARLASLYFSMEEGVFTDSEEAGMELRELDPDLADILENKEIEKLEEVITDGLEPEAVGSLEEDSGEDVNLAKSKRKLSGFWGLMARLSMSFQSEDSKSSEPQSRVGSLEPGGKNVDVLSEVPEQPMETLEKQLAEEKIKLTRLLSYARTRVFNASMPGQRKRLEESLRSIVDDITPIIFKDDQPSAYLVQIGENYYYLPISPSLEVHSGSTGDGPSYLNTRIPGVDFFANPNHELSAQRILSITSLPKLRIDGGTFKLVQPGQAEIDINLKERPLEVVPANEPEGPVLPEAPAEEPVVERSFNDWFFGSVLPRVLGRFVTNEEAVVDEEEVPPGNIEILSVEPEPELVEPELIEPEPVEEVLSEGPSESVEVAESEGGFQNWFFGVALPKVLGRFVPTEEVSEEEVIASGNIEVLSAEPEEIPEADVEVMSTEAIAAAENWNKLAEEGEGKLPKGYKVNGKNGSLIEAPVKGESRGGSYLMPSTMKMTGSPALVNVWFDVENPPADMDAHSLEDYELVKPAWVKDSNNIVHLYALNDTFTGKPDPEILEKGTLRYVGPQS